MSDRRKNFDEAISDVDEKSLSKAVDFDKHRFVTVERDAATSHVYVKGHHSMQAACKHLSTAIEEGEPYIPLNVIDLDTGIKHELDLFVHLAPKTVDAVSILMPRNVAVLVEQVCRADGAALNIDEPTTVAKASVLIKQAIDRR